MFNSKGSNFDQDDFNKIWMKLCCFDSTHAFTTVNESSAIKSDINQYSSYIYWFKHSQALRCKNHG